MRALVTIMLLAAIFALTPLATATETIFDSKSYVPGEAGLIAPVEREAPESVSVSVPITVWDGNYWYRFVEEKETNLSGPLPDFAKDYMIGEGGLVNPIERTMEK